MPATIPSHTALLFFFETEFCSCHPSWSTVARSQFTASLTSQVQVILLSASRVAGITGTHLHNWHIFLFLVETGFTVLTRLISNSWPHDHPPRPPKVIGFLICLSRLAECNDNQAHNYLLSTHYIPGINRDSQNMIHQLRNNKNKTQENKKLKNLPCGKCH